MGTSRRSSEQGGMSTDTSSCASLEVASEGSPDAPVKFPTSGVKVLTERGRWRLGELEGDKLDVVNFGHLEGEKFDVVNFKIEDHHDMRFNQHLCAQAPHKMAMSFGLDRQRSNWEFCAARLDSCGSGSTLARDFLYGVSGRLGREGVSPLGLEEMDNLDNWPGSPTSSVAATRQTASVSWSLTTRTPKTLRAWIWQEESPMVNSSLV